MGQLLLGPVDMPASTKGTITLVCMTGFSLAGFYVQQWLIEKHYSGEQAELHVAVRKIKEREMMAIARQGGGDASMDAVRQVSKGHDALIHGRGILSREHPKPAA